MFDDELCGGFGAIEDEIISVKAVGLGDFRGALAGIVVNEQHAHDLLGAVRDERHARESARKNSGESIGHE